MDELSDRFLDAISRLEAVADAVGPHDAYRRLDETSMQVFWRRWPGISSWAGSLWRLLNDELMDPAVSAHWRWSVPARARGPDAEPRRGEVIDRRRREDGRCQVEGQLDQRPVPGPRP